MAGSWVRPKNVPWANLPSWVCKASSNSFFRWPKTFTHRDETPSRNRRPCTSFRHTPSADSMITGSRRALSVCWVKGCQMYCLSHFSKSECVLVSGEQLAVSRKLLFCCCSLLTADCSLLTLVNSAGTSNLLDESFISLQ